MGRIKTVKLRSEISGVETKTDKYMTTQKESMK